jgi:hypothetical protein
MKRTFATLGVVGLGLIGLTAPAIAANERVTVCHNDGGSWSPLEFNVNGLGGHEQHPLDIIPPTSQSPGKNWTDAGKLLYVEQCAALPPGETLPVVEQPPVVVVPPVEQPPVVVVPPVEQPPAVTPVVDPPATTPDPVAEVPAAVVDPPAVTVEQPAAVAPAAGAVAAPAKPAAAQPAARTGTPAAATSLGTNQGYNAQTAVGGGSSPAWLAGLGALAAAGAAVAVRRRSGTAPAAG